jgi:hypothetical protein
MDKVKIAKHNLIKKEFEYKQALENYVDEYNKSLIKVTPEQLSKAGARAKSGGGHSITLKHYSLAGKSLACFYTGTDGEEIKGNCRKGIIGNKDSDESCYYVEPYYYNKYFVY